MPGIQILHRTGDICFIITEAGIQVVLLQHVSNFMTLDVTTTEGGFEGNICAPDCGGRKKKFVWALVMHCFSCLLLGRSSSVITICDDMLCFAKNTKEVSERTFCFIC